MPWLRIHIIINMHLFGLLTLNSFYHAEPAAIGAQLVVVLGALGIAGYLTVMRRWGWLWREWLTSTSPMRIGIMYILLSAVMGLRGFADASLMREQQAYPVGLLSPDHYAQIFTAHGVIMIFFVAMPFMFGLINCIVPLQLGQKDVAFPLLNSMSFWMTFAGAMLLNASLVAGQFAATGWLAYPPLSELQYSPGVGVDYYIWALQISGLGTLLSGINFIATITTLRQKAQGWMQLPMFTWTTFAAMLMVVFAFPILTATLAMLSLDRMLGMHFFTTALGGNAMMYVNLIWAWGHPEVYILILPCFGIFSEVVATFSHKRLFGYTSMVVATMAISILSFLVWLHHFFTMGAGADVNAFFGIMTGVIAIPTGVKVFNWLFTMFRGRIEFKTPMLWFMGFLSTFVLGGMTGVLLSIPAADYQLHNSLFLVAHFHNMIIGGVLFGFFAGLAYWFPKIFGFTLDERLGTWAFWLWLVGFLMAFIPLYALGLMGATRRMVDAASIPAFHPLLIIAAIGVVIIGAGFAMQLAQLYVSIRTRSKRRAPANPWGGTTLEWQVPSPAPILDEHHWLGPITGALFFAIGGALVWHIWWLAALSLILTIGAIIANSFAHTRAHV